MAECDSLLDPLDANRAAWAITARQVCADQRDLGYQKCTDERDIGHSECTKTRDDGYNACSQRRDDGYNRMWPRNGKEWLELPTVVARVLLEPVRVPYIDVDHLVEGDRA